LKTEGSCNGNSDNPDYTHMVSLENDKSILFYYKLSNDDDEKKSLSAQILYKGKGYVSWANSPTGMMVYSEAVIGLPDQPISVSNPGKYALTTLEDDGVNLMASQTLINSNITQDDTTTILSFTKLLDEDGELPINPNAVNTFTWAIGTENELGYHIKRSSFQIDLSKTCSNDPSDFVISLNGQQQPVSLSYWKAHGILAGISWSIFVPFAIMSSWYRDLLNGPIWMKLHLYLNIACAFFTTLSFIIALVAVAKSGGQHFNAPHQRLGLAMFILVIVQTANGYFRPPKGASKQTYKRRGWEYVHKLLGYILFIASIWEVQEGLKLYEIRSGKDYRQFFWGWVVALAFVNAIVFFYIYIYLGVICEEPVPIETFTDKLPVSFPRYTPGVRYSEQGHITTLAKEESKLDTSKKRIVKKK